MVKAAHYIKTADGRVFQVGDILPDDLVYEYERLSPHLLDCYVELNGRYFKKVGKKLIPHYDILIEDKVEVKEKPKEFQPEKPKAEEKPKKKKK